MLSKEFLFMMMAQGGGAFTKWLAHNTYTIDATGAGDRPTDDVGRYKIIDTSDDDTVVSGGKLAITGKSVYGNPGVWFGSDNAGSIGPVTLGAGKAALWDFSRVDDGSMKLGFDIDTVGDVAWPVFQLLSGSSLQYRSSNPTYHEIGTATNSERLKALLVQLPVGHAFLKNGNLLWIDELAQTVAGYGDIGTYTASPDIYEDGIIDLVDNGHGVWAESWKEVTDSKTDPGDNVTFNCNADCHISTDFTFETGKLLQLKFRYVDNANMWKVYVKTNGAVWLESHNGGVDTTVDTGSTCADGVAYTIDVVAHGSSIVVYLNGVLDLEGTDTFAMDYAGGRIDHNFVVNPTSILTHPWPALGIATSHILHVPEHTDPLCDCPEDFFAQFTVDDLGGGTYIYMHFRWGGSSGDSIQVRIAPDGSYTIYSAVGGSFSVVMAGAAASITAGDKLSLWCKGSDARLYINHTVGDTCSDMDIRGTGMATRDFGYPIAYISDLACYAIDQESNLLEELYSRDWYPSDIPLDEALALIWLYEHTDGDNWVDNSGWLKNTLANDWYGVTVVGGHVTSLVLNANGLNGDVASCPLVDLPSVETLNLSTNATLSGDISGWTLPAGLRILYLQSTGLSGDLSSLAVPATTTHLYAYSSAFSAGFNMSGAAAIRYYRIYNLSLSEAAVDAVLLELYTNRASYTNAVPAMMIGGTNAAPSGIYQDGDPPTTGNEYRYEIVNDPESEGFNVWTVDV